MSFALLAVLTAVVAQAVAGFIPTTWTANIGAEAVDQVLSILASSMLAVTTFSLGISISAFAAAASTATPRATALLQEDTTAQNVLATFLGAFLFSLVGIIALKAGYYTSAGRLVLFVMTAAVIAAVVMALLRWITHLITFGRMADTLARVEAAASASLERRAQSLHLGGRPLRTEVPGSCVEILSQETGYIQHVAVDALDACANQTNIKIWLNVLPGSFVHEASPLFFVDRRVSDEDTMKRMRSAFTIGAERSFEQDPRFGLIVMSEIASRALSPAVNDPGTAISVVGRLVRILSHWRENSKSEIIYQSVFVPPVSVVDMIEDAFRPIVRDGSGIVEVQIRVQKALHALGRISPDIFADATTTMAAEARSHESLTASERQMLEKHTSAKAT